MATATITRPIVRETRDELHEQPTKHDIELERLELERYGDTGIDERGTLGNY